MDFIIVHQLYIQGRHGTSTRGVGVGVGVGVGASGAGGAGRGGGGVGGSATSWMGCLLGRGGRRGGSGNTGPTNTATDVWVDDLNCTEFHNGSVASSSATTTRGGGGVINNAVNINSAEGARLINSLVVTYRSGVSQVRTDKS